MAGPNDLYTFVELAYNEDSTIFSYLNLANKKGSIRIRFSKSINH